VLLLVLGTFSFAGVLFGSLCCFVIDLSNVSVAVYESLLPWAQQVGGGTLVGIH